jgi:hypothetical protein
MPFFDSECFNSVSPSASTFSLDASFRIEWHARNSGRFFLRRQFGVLYANRCKLIPLRTAPLFAPSQKFKFDTSKRNA